MAYDGFRGTACGPVQTVVTDQPGVGVPGMLPFAGDNDLIDSYTVGSGGVFAGAGVRLATPTIASTKEDYNSLHNVPLDEATLPTTGTTAAEFKGVCIFDENMQSDSNGVPGWNAGRLCRIGRPIRAGVRVWVRAEDAWTKGSSTVNWVIVAGSDGKYAAGEFSPAALGGSSTVGYSVLLAATCAICKTSAPADGLVLIEFRGIGA